MIYRVSVLTLAALFCLQGSLSQAASYASGVRNTGGSTYEFVLNEASSNVTVVRDGGNALDLGALGVGRHTFDLGAFSSFDIEVSSSSAAGFNAVDDSANLFTSFERPGGLAINTIPSSPYFGTIYVNQNRGDLNSSALVFEPAVTAAGRTVGNGIYSLTADRFGVNLTDFSAQVDVNNTANAKTAGITFDDASSSSFFRIGMDDGGNIIAGDWTNTLGGLKYLSADLTTGAELFTQTGAGTGGVIAVDGQGPYISHGSIVGEPQVSGTYGVDLVVSAMDEDTDVDFTFDNANDGNAVWSWDFGSATTPSAPRPELVVAPGDLYTSSGQDKNTSGVNFPAFSENPAGTHSDGSPVFLDYNIGVMANAQYNAHFDKWYLSGARSNGDDSSSLVILTPEGPGGDGRDIQVDWASKQFSIDNGLDGFDTQTVEDDPDQLSADPNNDIFRQTHNVTFSPDNTMMYVQRRLVHSTNSVLGTGTDFGTKILGIPLDENGLPDIEIDDNGTPGDTSDDTFTNIIAIDAGVAGSSGTFSQVKTDAAGNLYYTGNQSEALEYFSLGGNFIATTSNNAGLTAGDFVIASVEPLAGDYNGDGTVDAADYTIYADTEGDSVPMGSGADGNGNGVIDPGDYTIWANNYGATSGGSSVAIPEPAAALLAGLCLAPLFRRR